MKELFKKTLTNAKESVRVLKERLGMKPIEIKNPFLGEKEMQTSKAVKTPIREITFVKANNETRKMRFQRLSELPKSDSKYNETPLNGSMETVYDVENKAFRIINHGTVVTAEKIVG